MAPMAPGTKVVDLVASSTASGVAAGVVTGGIARWLMHAVGASLVIGVVLGVMFARAVARTMFADSSGNVTVVPVGPGALPVTVRAAAIASAVSSTAVLVLVAFIGPRDWSGIAALAALVGGVLAGLLVARLSALA